MMNTSPVGRGRMPDIGTINSCLLILLAFFFMISVAIGNALLLLILALWLLEGRFAEKFRQIRDNPFVFAVMAFVSLHFVGLLWTSDWEFAASILEKESKYLLLPVLMTALKREHIPYYIGAFMLSMLLLVTLSYGLYAGVVPEYTFLRLKEVNDSTPFVHHIVYNPVLAFTLYLLLYAAFMMKGVSLKWRVMAVLLFVLMAVNMFLTPGRMGQLVFLVLTVLFVFQYYRGRMLRPFLLALLLVIFIMPAAYRFSPVVQERVELALHEFRHYEQEPNSSIGLRVIMLLNSFEIIAENPWIGVGTGDYRQEYRRVNQKNFPEATRGEILRHPHNVYVQQMVLFGVLGLLSLGYLFYSMWVLYRESSGTYRPVMLAFPVFYAVISLSDGYLMNHHLTLFFLLFGALLYARLESSGD